MTNLVVISFPNEENARKGAHRLKKLESLGDISMYGKVTIRKNKTGEITELKTDASEDLPAPSIAAFSALLGRVGEAVRPVAILAEINEDDPFLVDDELSSLGAKVFRSDVDYIYNDYEGGEVKELDEDIEAGRKELRSAVAADDKLRVKRKIDGLKEKRRRRIQELRAKHSDAKKVRLINRIQRHKEEIFRLEQRIDEIERRSKELKYQNKF